jgi:hypothetical protein
MASGWFEIVYEDRDCTVLHVLDQKKETAPPTEEDEDLDSEEENGN